VKRVGLGRELSARPREQRVNRRAIAGRERVQIDATAAANLRAFPAKSGEAAESLDREVIGQLNYNPTAFQAVSTAFATEG